MSAHVKNALDAAETRAIAINYVVPLTMFQILKRSLPKILE